MTARSAKQKRKPAAIWRSCSPLTLLDAFCRNYGITTPELADASRLSRQHTGRVRAGKVPYVTIDTAKQLALGASRLVRRKVGVGELFDLEIDYRAPVRRRGNAT